MKRMKFLVPVMAIVMGVVALSSCNKLKDVAKVNIGLNSKQVDFTIPVIDKTGQMDLAAFDVYVNVDSIIQANNLSVTANNIQSVKITSCDIVMNDGDAQNNFAVLQSGKAELASNTKTDMLTVAELTDNPDVQAYTLSLPVNSNVNLKDYFNATTFSYKLSGFARRTTSKEIHCTATIHYNLVAGL